MLDQLFTLIVVPLRNLGFHGLLLGLQLLALFLHGFGPGSHLRLAFFGFLALMTIDLLLYLLLFLELHLAEPFLFVLDQGLALTDGFEHPLVVFLLLSGLEGLALSNGLLDHLFLALHLLTHALLAILLLSFRSSYGHCD